MDTQLSTIVKEETPLAKITNYLESPVVLARFSKIMGKKAAEAYIGSVLIAVANSTSLQKCTPTSIYISALRAATLRLSVDPSTKQAHLVAYGNKATLVPGYKGYYDMAVRTNRYRYINVGKIYEGQDVEEDQITGFHKIVGHRTGDEIIGWIGAFEMLPKFGMYAKTIYMTVEEIHQHAQRYSKGYGKPDKDGVLVDKYGNPTIWHTEREKMEKKTVLIQLLSKWGYLDPADTQILEEIAAENKDDNLGEINAIAERADFKESTSVIDTQSDDVSEVDIHPMTIQEARQVLVTIAGKDRFVGELSVDELNTLYVKSNVSAEIEAAKLVLKEDYSMEPPTEEKNLKELGF